MEPSSASALMSTVPFFVCLSALEIRLTKTRCNLELSASTFGRSSAAGSVSAGGVRIRSGAARCDASGRRRHGFLRDSAAENAGAGHFLTARDENDDVIKGFRSGGDDYIIKPFDLNVLKARIEAQLRRNAKPDAQHPRIEMPDLTIDLFSGTAELAGNACPLPQRELQILYLLASRIGSRISYHEIYEKIYGCDVEDSRNTVRVNISRLKKHLEMDDTSTYEIASTSEGEYVLRRVVF